MESQVEREREQVRLEDIEMPTVDAPDVVEGGMTTEQEEADLEQQMQIAPSYTQEVDESGPDVQEQVLNKLFIDNVFVLHFYNPCIFIVFLFTLQQIINYFQ